MIKNIFLSCKSKPTITSKQHCTYSEATNMGILYHANDFPICTITNLEEQFKEDGKNITSIGYVDNPTGKTFLFSKKDISRTGGIKKNQLRFFINQPFHFLISLDTSQDINYKYVLAISKAICKIGFETAQYYDLLQMSFRINRNKSDIIKNMIKYLKMVQ